MFIEYKRIILQNYIAAQFTKYNEIFTTENPDLDRT